MITNENFWRLFGGVWLAVGLLFLLIGGGIGLERRAGAARLDEEGMTTDGIVLTKARQSSDDSANADSVTFRFIDARGATVHGSASLDPVAWDALVERGPIRVVYLPERPDVHRVPGQRSGEAVLAFVFPLVGLVLAALGAFVLLNARRIRRGDGAP